MVKGYYYHISIILPVIMVIIDRQIIEMARGLFLNNNAAVKLDAVPDAIRNMDMKMK